MILIGADIVPSSSNEKLFFSGNLDLLMGVGLKNLFNESDYNILNLEVPLVDFSSPIEKSGPVLRANTKCINAIKRMGVDLFTLANNHIMDQGVIGLESTIDLLKRNNICFVGAGRNIEESRKSFLVEVNGKRIGFYACAEHEFSIADDFNPGANPFDPLESLDHVFELRKKCDFLIVLYHGGKEHYRYPSPVLQRVCRKIIQKGANLVVCQHSHCIGCEEKYDGKTIVYGQGNFLFDDDHGPYSNTSLLIKINDDFSIEYLPLIKVEGGVRLADGKNAENILQQFNSRSEQIKQDAFIFEEYKKFAMQSFDSYMLACMGYGHRFFLKILNRLTAYRLTKLLVGSYKKKELLYLRGVIQCEAHRELWLEGLKNKLEK